MRTGNATQAYIDAGMTSNRNSAATGGAQWLARQDVQARIAELREERRRAVDLDVNEIIQAALNILRADPLATVDEFGATLALDSIPHEVRMALAGYEQDTVGTTGAVVRTKLKFHDKMKAIETLGKHLGIFKDALVVEGLEDIAKRIIDARRAEHAKLIELQPEDLV